MEWKARAGRCSADWTASLLVLTLARTALSMEAMAALKRLESARGLFQRIETYRAGLVAPGGPPCSFALVDRLLEKSEWQHRCVDTHDKGPTNNKVRKR